MKLNLYYQTAPLHTNNYFVIITHDEKLKNNPDYLYVPKSHRPEKNFLLISSKLCEFLEKHPQVTSLYAHDTHEILYYPSFLGRYKLEWNDSELEISNKTYLEYQLIKEARDYLKKREFTAKTNKTYPHFSVIMTTFNRTTELEEALTALTNQSDSDFELIVVNDGSNSQDVLQYHLELKKKFFKSRPNWKWIDQENAYLGAARNTGAKAAEGDTLLFLDDDNIPYPEMIKTYRFYWQSYPHLVFNSCFDIFEHETSKHLYAWAPFSHSQFSHTLMNVIGDAQMVIDKNIFERMGGYTTDRLGYEDWEFYLKLKIAQIDIYPIFKKLYNYRVKTKGSSMRSQSQSIENYQRAFRPLSANQPRLARSLLINHTLHLKNSNKNILKSH